MTSGAVPLAPLESITTQSLLGSSPGASYGVTAYNPETLGISLSGNTANTSYGITDLPDYTGSNPIVTGAQQALQEAINPSSNPASEAIGVGVLGTLGNMTTPGTGAVGALFSASKANDFWSDLFLRTVIIILGFIFVDIGLSMFRGSQPIIVKTFGGKK